MTAPQMEMKEQNIQGEFSTAEVTHTIETLEMEGKRYLENHLAMGLSGVEGPIREFHDNCTRPNLDRLVRVAEDIGIPLPFAKPLEDRENEMKAKLKNANVEGTITEGEAIQGALIDAKARIDFYAVSFNLASHPKVRDVFKQNLQTTMDQKTKLLDAFKNTKEYVALPVAKNVQLKDVLTKGVQPSEARAGGTRGT